MSNFKITKTILENINEQNDRINECVDIVNGYTTDEETRVNQELQRQENELRREEQYKNNENRFTEINTQLDNNTNKLNGITTSTSFESITKAVENGGNVKMPQGTISEDIVPLIKKPFILEGQGEQATSLNLINSTTPFITTTLYSMGFKNLMLDCTNSSGDYVIDYRGSSNRIYIDNVFIKNVKNNGVIAKTGMASIFRDSYIYGETNKTTGVGIQLGVDTNDWQNINNFSNLHIAWFNTGWLFKNSVVNNINGCHIYQCVKAIELETNPPNPTRDINIQGCYFEQNKIGIYANPNGIIRNLNIEKCYFACDTLIDLKKIDGLKISDCSYVANYSSQTGNVLLSDISNLVINNKNNMIFKTHKGNPIIFGDTNNCENRLLSANKSTSYVITGADVSNTKDSINEYNGNVVDSFSLNNNTLQHSIKKRIMYSSNNGYAGDYMSSRLIGFSGLFKPSVDCNIKIFIADDVETYKFKIIESDLIGGVYNKVEGVGITGDFINKNIINIQYLITKKQATDTIKLAFDECQLWFDYYNKPKYIRNDTNYPIVSRPKNITVSDITNSKGIFVLSGEEIIKTNQSVFNTETINKWLVNKTGYIKNGLSKWTQNTTYRKGDYCYLKTGQLVQCLNDGISGSTEINPTQVSEIIQDNSIKWLAITNSDVSATVVEKTYI